MTAMILSVKNLTVKSGRVTILRKISWEVLPGQNWVILGANGSGKTCLLSTLTGYLTPSDGEITVLGKKYEAYDWRELRKEIGLVSSSIRQMISDDETGLNIILSGKDAVLNYWGKRHKHGLQYAKRILNQIECGHLVDRPWLVLSQGERQRLLIGRALTAKAKILILDEPCVGLDPVARENFLKFINRLKKKRKEITFIFVTHHVEEISSIFTHCLLLRKGKITFQGKIQKQLTSQKLSNAFDSNIRVSKYQGRYRLEIKAQKGMVT
jgi:iron complex transport system ATP-binding protein